MEKLVQNMDWTEVNKCQETQPEGCEISRKNSWYGFTVIEIMIVVVIVAIAAMMIIPMISSAAGFQVRSAANMIAADIEYAKNMAITKGQNFSVVFDKTQESYSLRDQDGAVIAHPVKKGFDYVISFSEESRLNKVEIDDVDFDPDSGNTITFDYLGSPYSGSGTSNPLDGGRIDIQADEMSVTITIEPITGFISISD